MEKGNRRNVFEVYDKIATWFSENRYTGLLEKPYLDKLISFLPVDAKILDLGCGTGKPILEYLFNSGFKVVGVDASQKMLEIAIQSFPSVAFIQQDMRVLSLNEKFDAIIAWDSFFHLPADDQRAMFDVFKNNINPKGLLLFTSGTALGEAWGINGGENLFHASLDAREYKALLEQNKFVVLEAGVNDENCDRAAVWLAQYNPS
ncbi:class I SAM-dependent methyltransferase [Pedobacter nototheniae]|uniref:class I SAM-dependent DNA methyltransferase n=1 Tax=Pedobacter nototheniae TaxID=2488994 RepID=UPI00292D81DD|nr:class I SAM-dependent methyltransferase [Pedobacter nototheniae]